MKIIDFTEEKIKSYVENIRPSEEIRNEVDINFTYKKGVLEIFEKRPQQSDSTSFIQIPIFKTRYYKSQDIWKIYWMMGNGKWVPYEPNHIVKNIDHALQILEQDELCCFWG